ncbi:MAG: prepilin peptidase [Catenulispora sp.]|nr:prepilin peptidase [Catenulispora sp.]
MPEIKMGPGLETNTELEVELETEEELEAAEAVDGTEVTEAAEIAGGPAGPEALETTAPAAEPERLPWQPVVARWRIPVTVGTVLLEAGILLRLGLHWTTLPVLAFAATAVALTVIDFAVLRLPNALTAPTALAVAATAAVQAVADHDTHRLVTEVEGALGVGLFYSVLYLLSRGGLGIGDVKLGMVAGLVLASRGWTHVFNGTLLAYVITLVIALAMMSRGRKRFPYGPGLIAGAITALLLMP